MFLLGAILVEMLLKEKYFAADKVKSLICTVFKKTEMILFCMYDPFLQSSFNSFLQKFFFIKFFFFKV